MCHVRCTPADRNAECGGIVYTYTATSVPGDRAQGGQRQDTTDVETWRGARCRAHKVLITVPRPSPSADSKYRGTVQRSRHSVRHICPCAAAGECWLGAASAFPSLAALAPLSRPLELDGGSCTTQIAHGSRVCSPRSGQRPAAMLQRGLKAPRVSVAHGHGCSAAIESMQQGACPKHLSQLSALCQTGAGRPLTAFTPGRRHVTAGVVP